MKEILLTGTVGTVLADVLGSLLSKGLSVNALVDAPEKIMIDDTRLHVGHMPVEKHDEVKNLFTGYDTAVLTYSDDLEDKYTNDRTLKYFVDTVFAAREAGVKRIVVVGSPQSTAFFVSELRRLDDIDWVFISTRNNYPGRTASEVVEPRFHRAIFPED